MNMKIRGRYFACLFALVLVFVLHAFISEDSIVSRILPSNRLCLLYYSNSKDCVYRKQPPENYNLSRTFCSMEFEAGNMCPALYAEVGGNCSYHNNKAVCRDVRTSSPYNLRQVQLTITKLLGTFDLIARKHGIKYWLTAGTLLGAFRHKGFIPWDNDADIQMTLHEYEKFYRIGSHDLPADIFFQNSESDPSLRPSDPKKYEQLKYKDIGLYRRTFNPRLRDVKSCYKYCIRFGCKWHDGLQIDIFVLESVPKRTYPLREILFEGLSFPIQNNWREVLSDEFGDDFMEMPKEGSSNRFPKMLPDPIHSCDEIQKSLLLSR